MSSVVMSSFPTLEGHEGGKSGSLALAEPLLGLRVSES